MKLRSGFGLNELLGANVQAIEQPSKLQASMEPRRRGRARDNGAPLLRRSELGFGDGPGQGRRVVAEGETGTRARKVGSRCLLDAKEQGISMRQLNLSESRLAPNA